TSSFVNRIWHFRDLRPWSVSWTNLSVRTPLSMDHAAALSGKLGQNLTGQAAPVVSGCIELAPGVGWLMKGVGELAGCSGVDGAGGHETEDIMGRGLLLWLIGIPIPIIIVVWLLGGLH